MTIPLLSVLGAPRRRPVPELSLCPGLQDHEGRPARRFTPVSRAGLFVLAADLVGLLVPAAFAMEGRLWLLVMASVAVLLFQSAGLYRPHLHLSVLDELPALISRSGGAAAFTGLLLGLLGSQGVLRAFLVQAVAAVILQASARTVAYRLIARVRAGGAATYDTLLLGGGRVSTDIASTLLNRPSYGLRPVGFLDSDPLFGDGDRPVPHLGGAQDLGHVLRSRAIKVLVVAFGSHREADLIKVLRASEQSGVEVFVVPRLFEVHSNNGRRDHIGAIPVTRVRRARLGRGSWAVKRFLDVAVAMLGLLILTPLLAVVAVAVRIEGGPGVLFRQQRIGLDGRTFELLKFRSLKPVDELESATNWNVAHDHRLGRVGKLLRRTSVDELPQLWNIVRGEMSLVGPRPERPHFVERFSAEFANYDHRHRVPCGLTGLSQISGLRGDTSIAARARYDNMYIENWSLWLDVKILLETAREVVGARGA